MGHAISAGAGDVAVQHHAVLTFDRNVKISQFDTHWQGIACRKMFNWARIARDSRKGFKLADAPSVFFIFDSNARGTAVGSRLGRCRCLLQGILSWHGRRRKFHSDCLSFEGSHISWFHGCLSAWFFRRSYFMLVWFNWKPNRAQGIPNHQEVWVNNSSDILDLYSTSIQSIKL